MENSIIILFKRDGELCERDQGRKYYGIYYEITGHSLIILLEFGVGFLPFESDY
jgi:hypothetical protein